MLSIILRHYVNLKQQRKILRLAKFIYRAFLPRDTF